MTDNNGTSLCAVTQHPKSAPSPYDRPYCLPRRHADQYVLLPERNFFIPTMPRGSKRFSIFACFCHRLRLCIPTKWQRTVNIFSARHQTDRALSCISSSMSSLSDFAWVCGVTANHEQLSYFMLHKNTVHSKTILVRTTNYDACGYTGYGCFATTAERLLG